MGATHMVQRAVRTLDRHAAKVDVPPVLQGFRSGIGSDVGVAAIAELPELLPMPLDLEKCATVLDMLLRHCLEGKAYLADELFHFCVMKWMMARELPVVRYESPYVRSFLEMHARDQPELLCHYFQQRGHWSEACDAYFALARGGSTRPATEDCLVHLQ